MEHDVRCVQGVVYGASAQRAAAHAGLSEADVAQAIEQLHVHAQPCAKRSPRRPPPSVAGILWQRPPLLIPTQSKVTPVTLSRLAFEEAKRAGLAVHGAPSVFKHTSAAKEAGMSSSAPVSPWGRPRAWASNASPAQGRSALVQHSPAISIQMHASPPTSVEASPTRATRQAKTWAKPKSKAQSMEQLYARAHERFDAPLTVPVGLINQGNSCFASVVRRPTHPDPPNARVLPSAVQLSYRAPRDRAARPVELDAAARGCVRAKDSPRFRFYTEIPLADDRVLETDVDPILPDYVYDAMRLHKRFDLFQLGHQEDAEEFFSLVLSTLHDEVLLVEQRAEARRSADRSAHRRMASMPHLDTHTDDHVEQREITRPESPEQDQWLEVGQKGKTSLTRTATTREGQSPVSRMFDGKLRNVLTIPGSKTSIVLEPYRSLPLDIQPDSVRTIEDALRHITVPEEISGVWSPGRGAFVDATKQVLIEMLPPVLVLHLKRFVFDEVGGVQKSCKTITYGHTLAIDPAVLSAPLRRADPAPQYKLFGVVYHHGRLATGGHYTASVLRQDGSGWMHIDDTYARPIPAEDVLRADLCNEGTTSPAYLLFYHRL